MEGELAYDGLEALEVFALCEREDVLFTDSSAIQRKTVAKTAKIVEEINCLILWHGYPGFVAVLHD